MQAALVLHNGDSGIQDNDFRKCVPCLCCCCILAIVSQAFGILLSSLAKREAQAVQFIPFIILPVFLLSGIFWPIQAIPLWLRPLSYFVPPTYAVDACRSIFLKGWGISKVWPDIWLICCYLFLYTCNMVS